jgi:pyrroloquinoline quinone biosynthesis protein D
VAPPRLRGDGESLTWTPRLARSARLRHDRVRGRWILLGPERGFLLNASALAIVKCLQEGGTVAEIAARLLPAPLEEVVAFVEKLVALQLVEECQ